jgi:aryl-alcohol dehydrogenase
MSALLAAVAIGCTTVIAVDLHPARLDLATELGAAHTFDGRDPDLTEKILTATGGLDFAVDTTGRASVATAAMNCLALGGVLALHGLYTPDGNGTDLAALAAGRSVTNLIEGDSVPQRMVPTLLDLYHQGRFPFDKLVQFYDFADINQAIDDAVSGKTIKPVVRFAQ